MGSFTTQEALRYCSCVHDDYVQFTILEVPIPNQHPTGNLQGTGISTRLKLNCDWVGTNSAMTHYVVLSAK